MSNRDDSSCPWVDVDLSALVANAKTVATVSRARLLPMVKADAYGLGAVPVARALETIAPWGYGVATAREGESLRAAGISRPIVVFTPPRPAEFARLLAADLRPAIGDLERLRAWLGAGSRPFHLEIDTGMARAGIRWHDAAALTEARRLLEGASGFEGIFTHFHSAESDVPTAEQWERFVGILDSLSERPPLVHAANSAAALRGTGYAADLVRPGIFLYGGYPGPPSPLAVAVLRAPVVARRRVRAGDTVSYGAVWRAERETEVLTLGIGYADGLPRALTNRGCVEIGGEIVPIVGRVTMDMTMIAVSGAAAESLVVTVYGGRTSLVSQAAAAGLVPYELLTGLGSRVERRYREESAT